MNMGAPIIHVAYAIGRRGGTHYRAVAVVKNEGMKCHHTHRVCIEDTAADAEAGAIRYIVETYQREGLAPPVDVVRHGRMHSVDIETVSFAR